jgi:predicted Zn-dependent protease with MMP-like domain
MTQDDWTTRTAPSIEDLKALAERAFAGLPLQFRKAAGDVTILVADFADEDVLDEMGVEDAFELTGLYQGVDLRRRSYLDPLPHMSRVFLYRRPILDEWAERGDVTLGELVEHVLIHEIGHHLGLSDADIEAIEAQA